MPRLVAKDFVNRIRNSIGCLYLFPSLISGQVVIMTLRGLWLMIRDIIATFKLAGDLAAGCPAGRTSFVRSRVGDPSAFGVGIPSALAHSLGSPLGASSLLGNPPRLAGSIISLIIRQSPHNVPLFFLERCHCTISMALEGRIKSHILWQPLCRK